MEDKGAAFLGADNITSAGVLKINGGIPLIGEISVQGAKNSALPLLAAALLVSGETTLTNCPKLLDIFAAVRIQSWLGCRCKAFAEKGVISVDASSLSGYTIPEELMRQMRSSIIFLGAVLGRTGRCRLYFPGGCELGPRPIDLHLSSLRRMGVLINEQHGTLDCSAPKGLHGAKIMLPFPSVGATENIILAAATAKGVTEIRNAAREPEIAELARFINRSGGRVTGAGESTIRIEGVETLTPCTYKVMPDRIVAATYMSAAAMTGGQLLLNNICPEHLESILPIFEEMGCNLYTYRDSLYIQAKGSLRPVKGIRTMPYPAFPTDAQAVVMAPLCIANGTSVVVETIFESRYKHVSQLTKLGADIQVEGQTAVVRGVKKLTGARVSATDLRGGAAMVVAGLGAEGETTVDQIFHIDRGYEDIEGIIRSVGGIISRS